MHGRLIKEKHMAKILFIDSPELFSGGQKMLASYLSFLPDLYRILIRPSGAPEPPDFWQAEKVYNIAFPTYPKNMSKLSVQLKCLPSTLRTAFNILRIIRKEKPDIIIANSFYELISLLIIKRFLPCPLGWIIHTSDVPHNKASYRLIKNCDMLIACCNSVLEPFKSLVPKHAVVYNAVSVENVVPGITAFQYFDDKRWVMGFLGRLDPSKNLQNLILAFKAVKQETTVNSGLLIIGDGPEKEKLETLIKTEGLSDSVKLTGYIKKPESIVASLNALCQPSVSVEALPLSILEAQSLKVPVMATSIGGVAEIIKDGVTGFIIPGTKVEDIAGSIKKMMMSDPMPIIRNASAQLETEFNMKRQKKDFRKALAQLIPLID